MIPHTEFHNEPPRDPYVKVPIKLQARLDALMARKDWLKIFYAMAWWYGPSNPRRDRLGVPHFPELSVEEKVEAGEALARAIDDGVEPDVLLDMLEWATHAAPWASMADAVNVAADGWKALAGKEKA